MEIGRLKRGVDRGLVDLKGGWGGGGVVSFDDHVGNGKWTITTLLRMIQIDAFPSMLPVGDLLSVTL